MTFFHLGRRVETPRVSTVAGRRIQQRILLLPEKVIRDLFPFETLPYKPRLSVGFSRVQRRVDLSSACSRPDLAGDGAS
jgi:hypothetical protein